MINMNIRY